MHDNSFELVPYAEYLEQVLVPHQKQQKELLLLAAAFDSPTAFVCDSSDILHLQASTPKFFTVALIQLLTAQMGSNIGITSGIMPELLQ
jgi:hypothetical protein